MRSMTAKGFRPVVPGAGFVDLKFAYLNGNEIKYCAISREDIVLANAYMGREVRNPHGNSKIKRVTELE